MQNARLWPMGLNPNVGAPMFNSGMFLLIYLLATYKRKWMIAPGALLVLLIFFACSLTGSRSGILGRSVALAIVICLLVSKIKISKKYLRIGLLLISFFAGFFLTYKATELSVNIMSRISDSIYASADADDESAVVENLEVDGVEVDTVAVSRNPLTNIGTLGSRTPIYLELFRGIRANPQVLLIDRIESEVMTLLDRYQAWMTLHNSFLQVLALTGVLGLLMILIFSVLVFLSTLKLFLADNRPMGQRMLPVIMVPLVLQGLLESILFVPWTTLGPSAIANFAFMLSAGYAIKMAKGLKFRQLLGIAEKKPAEQ